MEYVHHLAPHGSCITIHLSAGSTYTRQASLPWFIL
ncbi:hypothetical protein ACJIZ3_008911 [Penstemon smallii]|uniref:Uncharacterized protein n=1 Tax=Penstemon smallii TaxID=265156 RepID=A0ABD3TCE9_9LAMI